MIYLASPYAHSFFWVRWWRWFKVSQLAAQLIREGRSIYSPIAHNHWLAVLFRLPQSHAFWLAYDKKILAKCTELWIAAFPGWQKSRGIAEEIEFAEQHSIPVYVLGEFSGVPYPHSTSHEKTNATKREGP